MQKTKLGITVGLLGAAVFFSGLFSGYIVAILLAGYILLFEENIWLKKAGVKAVALMFLFSIATALVNLLPDLVGLVNRICYIFDGSFQIEILDKIVSLVVSGLALVEKVLFLILGFKALTQSTLPLPIIDSLINKYMD